MKSEKIFLAFSDQAPGAPGGGTDNSVRGNQIAVDWQMGEKWVKVKYCAFFCGNSEWTSVDGEPSSWKGAVENEIWEIVARVWRKLEFNFVSRSWWLQVITAVDFGED